jgi:hypothetical protein
VPVIQAWWRDYTNHALPPLRFSIIIFGVVLPLIVALLLWSLIRYGRHLKKELREGRPHAYLYEGGFICATKSTVQQVINWPEIDFCYETRYESGGDGSANGYVHNPQLILKSTRQPVRNWYFGSRFSKTVELALADYQYPTAQAAYQSGAIVPFGRIALSLQGLHDSKLNMVLAWNEVKSIKVDRDGTVRVKKVGERRDWVFFNGLELHNPALLRRLIQTYVAPQHAFELRLWG